MKYLFALLAICMVACNTDTPETSDEPEFDSEDSAKITTLFTATKVNRDSSIYFIQQAKSIAESSRSSRTQAIFWALLGKELVLTGKLDSADRIADKGLQLIYKQADLSLKGKFYNLKGQVQGLKKNPYPSIDNYLKAEKIFLEASDSSGLAGIYSNIANAYFSLKDYKTANQYAAKAYGLKGAVKDANIKANLTTTYALSLIKIQDATRALVIEREVDSLATATHNIMAKIAATIGYAEIYKTARQFDTAIKYYNDCIALSRKTGVRHFELMSNVGLLSLYEETGQTHEIIALADSTLLLAQMLNNTDILHTTKRIIGRAFAKQNDFQQGFQLLNESYNLYDSSAGTENQKNINELLVKYDAGKKEKEILSQNLLLAKQETVLRNRQIIILSLFLGLAILLIVYFYVRKLNRERLMRLEIEKQNNVADAYIQGEQKERTRLAFEIHDGIASMLTGITYKLRGEHANKEEVIGLLTGLHEDTRRISHSLMPIDFEQKNLSEAVESLCEKMSTKEVEVVLFSGAAYSKPDARKSLLLYRIIQELINNALKYAQCKSVFVRLGGNDAILEISVEDDGIGLPNETIENGFASIRERIKSLGANLSIESVMQEGTTIKITYKNE